MRVRILLIVAGVLAAFSLGVSVIVASSPENGKARVVTWDDTAPLRSHLEASGVTAAAFAARIQSIRQANARRVHEGDVDHLIFYILQSTKFTKLPPIEPALSAKELHDTNEVPAAVKSRAAAFLRSLQSPGGDPRLSHFRDFANATFRDRVRREDALLREYARVMKFVYEKEFVAQRSERRHAAIAELYRKRGLSTDTAIEAGFLVSEGLAVGRALDPGLRIRRVLIVGPGLDLAPRTSLREAGAPESYQPWAVLDALLALGLSRADDLTIVGADINPRVVQHLRRARGRARTLTFVSEIKEMENVSLSPEFRDYFARLGSQLAKEQRLAPSASAGHLAKNVRVESAVARALAGERLDIVTERLAGAPFDLIIATNVLPYFDDVELLLALTNISSMLAPRGLFLHNEARPIIDDFTEALGLRLEQSRHAIVANVRNAPPLVDSIFLHRKGQGSRAKGEGPRPIGGSAYPCFLAAVGHAEGSGLSAHKN